MDPKSKIRAGQPWVKPGDDSETKNWSHRKPLSQALVPASAF